MFSRLLLKFHFRAVSGRIDHIAYDEIHRIAFIAALGNNTVEVVNIETKQSLHSMTGMKAPQGIAYLPAWNRVVVADDGGSVSFFDASSFEKLSTIDVGDDADNVRYDDDAGLIYVGYGNGSIAVIEGGALKQVANIRLQGHPESFQLDKTQNRLYVNVPEADKIQVADLASLKVIADWKNEEASSNFPMALVKRAMLYLLFTGIPRF
jgi:DNA-binding beta-propeller fold protein YncE